MLSNKERLRSVKQACSRTIQNVRRADYFLRGGASPSMRERRVNGPMMPYGPARLQLTELPGPLLRTLYKSRRRLFFLRLS